MKTFYNKKVNMRIYDICFIKRTPSKRVETLKKGDLILARPKTRSLLDNIYEPYSGMLKSTWSRVRVNSVEDRKISVTYLDYCINDNINFINNLDTKLMSFDNYDLYVAPIKFLIFPVFNFEIKLSKVS